MIAVAANTFQDFLGQIIPGFKEQFHKTEQEKHAAGCLDSLVPRRQPLALTRAGAKGPRELWHDLLERCGTAFRVAHPS